MVGRETLSKQLNVIRNFLLGEDHAKKEAVQGNDPLMVELALQLKELRKVYARSVLGGYDMSTEIGCVFKHLLIITGEIEESLDRLEKEGRSEDLQVALETGNLAYQFIGKILELTEVKEIVEEAEVKGDDDDSGEEAPSE